MIGGAFVTGTDTGVGKTRVSAAMLRLLATHGATTAGLKPVAAGVDTASGLRANEDVAMLRASSSLPLTETEVGPCQLAAACAPHLAAALEGRRIEPAPLLRAAAALATRADWLVVEGVGGFRVPLGDRFDSADLAADLRLPVVLVVGLRLGCLNHTLLAAEAIAARDLRLAGWVANRIDPAMPHQDANVAWLRQALHPAPLLADLPSMSDPDPARLAGRFDHAAVRAALTCSSWSTKP